MSSPRLFFDGPLTIEEGDTLVSVLADQSWLDRYRVRRAAGRHGFEPWSLAIGTYGTLSGSLSIGDFYTWLAAGPSTMYEKVTVLEGWSIYDTDELLVDKWRIRPGEYISYVTDPAVIRDLRTQYSFLDIGPNGLSSLEWFLYPDTYYIDLDDPLLPQLVTLQMNAFSERIWLVMGNNILEWVARNDVWVSSYELLTMASVVLKEERNASYQSLVAGVFHNRLEANMRLDADITLCYGLAIPYESCAPRTIVEHLDDASNPYNTRAVAWLPPTPISSLTPAVVRAVIDVDFHDYMYYLHDPQGVIHPAVTYQKHLDNKKQYLQ